MSRSATTALHRAWPRRRSRSRRHLLQRVHPGWHFATGAVNCRIMLLRVAADPHWSAQVREAEARSARILDELARAREDLDALLGQRSTREKELTVHLVIRVYAVLPAGSPAH